MARPVRATGQDDSALAGFLNVLLYTIAFLSLSSLQSFYAFTFVFMH